jgi:DNA-binding NarL/FixJ family response regulator
MTLAGILATLGRAAEALAVLDEAERIDCERADSDRFRAHNARGNALFALGSSAAARAEYAAALEIAEQLDSVVLRLHALGNGANAALLTGAISAASTTYAAALELARQHGQHRHASMLEFDAGLAALYAGNLDGALETFRASPANRSAAPMFAGFAWAIGLRLRGLIDADDVDALDAASLVARALELRESQLVAAVAGAAARAALECAEAERARALLAAALPAVIEPDHAYWLCDAAAEAADDALAGAARAVLARLGDDEGNPLARAFLTLFDARRTQASNLARSASTAFESLGFPVEAALAAELAGDNARAIAIFGRIGAGRAVRRLTTGSVLTPTAVAAARLTRREREVAVLAAQGYANRLIASEIGVGERTVETHLGVVYRKLGVHSRVELAAALRAEVAS